jgi:hypothetical protein
MAPATAQRVNRSPTDRLLPVAGPGPRPEVIGDAKHRHKFVQQSVGYTTDHDTGVEYLREKHNEYLPDAMLAADEAPSG